MNSFQQQLKDLGADQKLIDVAGKVDADVAAAIVEMVRNPKEITTVTNLKNGYKVRTSYRVAGKLVTRQEFQAAAATAPSIRVEGYGPGVVFNNYVTSKIENARETWKHFVAQANRFNDGDYNLSLWV